MVHRFAFVAALAVVGVVPTGGPVPTGAQDAPAACAGALWLAPPAAPEETASPIGEVTTPAPAWLATKLTDACSGQTFTLADFAGKTLFVEAMATWCPPCRDQLTRLKDAAAQIPEDEREEIVLVALSTEVELPQEDLAAYAAANGFPFIFAVMPEEMLRAMVDDLGQEIAVAPATPHLVVAPDGAIGEVRTGSTSPEDLLGLLTEAGEAAS